VIGGPIVLAIYSEDRPSPESAITGAIEGALTGGARLCREASGV
jgi:hypothetical protein